VPEVFGFGEVGSRRFLIQQFISKREPRHDFWIDFGEKLAILHGISQPKYGLDVDNHIGRLHQKNDLLDDWTEFFIHNRLEFQLSLAQANGLVDLSLIDNFRKLYDLLPEMLVSSSPSLLHGDLWSGNFMTGSKGTACIYDPAVYFGNREIELSFTKLFGGFDHRFYEAYFGSYPVEPGFDERADLYNLYPLLVHVNLFGRSYLTGIEHTIRRYI
jgi:fructosamine-3-kinase